MKNEVDIKTLRNIIGNYREMEEAIVNELFFKCSHGLSIGGFREEVWKKLFESIIPRKFSVERSVFIIDSKGKVSNEIDLIIFDEQYTPYIFKYGTLKFIPIEAVAVVIECKSTSLDFDKLSNWVESIDSLSTSNASIARTASKIIVNEDKVYSGGNCNLTQTSTRPIKILCSLEKKSEIYDKFDFIIIANKREKKLNLICKKDAETLLWWHEELNHNKNRHELTNKWEGRKRLLKEYTIKDTDENENTILTLIFKLNQLLMLINNPMLFPHKAYVDMFNEVLKD